MPAKNKNEASKVSAPAKLPRQVYERELYQLRSNKTISPTVGRWST